VQWIADSRDTSHPVTAMQIYVDNKLVVNSPSSSLNEPLTLSSGAFCGHQGLGQLRREFCFQPQHHNLQRHAGRNLSNFRWNDEHLFAHAK
jgi:hypothetical protein